MDVVKKHMFNQNQADGHYRVRRAVSLTDPIPWTRFDDIMMNFSIFCVLFLLMGIGFHVRHSGLASFGGILPLICILVFFLANCVRVVTKDHISYIDFMIAFVSGFVVAYLLLLGTKLMLYMLNKDHKRIDFSCCWFRYTTQAEAQQEDQDPQEFELPTAIPTQVRSRPRDLQRLESNQTTQTQTEILDGSSTTSGEQPRVHTIHEEIKEQLTTEIGITEESAVQSTKGSDKSMTKTPKEDKDKAKSSREGSQAKECNELEQAKVQEEGGGLQGVDNPAATCM